MNTSKLSPFKPAAAGLAALVAASIVAQGQIVQEILDLGPGTSASDACVNPFPNDPWPAGLFVAAYTPALGYGVLSADLTQNPSAFGGIVDASAMRNVKLVSTTGALFEVGESMPDGNTAWHVRRSSDQGTTWQSLGPDWRLAAGKSASARGVTVDASGRVYTCGRAADSKGNFHPIVRRSLDNGATWTTVLDASRGANFDTVADIEFVPAIGTKLGGVFAVGRVGNNWTVWRSRDGGDTWSVVHSWVPSKGIAEATAIASDNKGSIYVGGMGNRVNYPRNWYVWVSVDNGATWQDLGCPLLSGTDCILEDLEIDETGSQLWAVGSQGQFNWRMQRWNVAGWTAPLYPYAGSWSRARGVAVDGATGVFYATGSVNDAAGQSHGTVLEIAN